MTPLLLALARGVIFADKVITGAFVFHSRRDFPFRIDCPSGNAGIPSAICECLIALGHASLPRRFVTFVISAAVVITLVMHLTGIIKVICRILIRGSPHPQICDGKCEYLPSVLQSTLAHSYIEALGGSYE